MWNSKTSSYFKRACLKLPVVFVYEFFVARLQLLLVSRNVEWDKIQWGPLDKNGKPSKDFAYGGAMVNGLLYTIAFVDGLIDGKARILPSVI